MDKEEVSERLVIKSRDELVKFMDDQTKWLIENPDCFKDFLVMSSVMDMIKNNYDIGDKILIFSQNPEARILNSKYVWERRGLCIKDNSNPILILGRTSEVAEMVGFDGDEYIVNYLYITTEQGVLTATGNPLRDRERLIRAGYGHMMRGKDDRSKDV